MELFLRLEAGARAGVCWWGAGGRAGGGRGIGGLGGELPLGDFGVEVYVEPAELQMVRTEEFLRGGGDGRGKVAYHSWYCSFHWAFQPSGTRGGGGPEGGA